MMLARLAALLSKNPSISIDDFYSWLMGDINHLHFDVNEEISNKTLLYFACQYENVPLVKVLLAMGANPNFRSGDFQSILGVCIDSNNLDLIKILVKAGVNLYHPYDQNTIENAPNEIYRYISKKREGTKQLSEDKQQALINFFGIHKLSVNFIKFDGNSDNWDLEKPENYKKIEEDLRQLHQGMRLAIEKENYFVVQCLLETKLIQFNSVYQKGSCTTPLKKIAEQGNEKIARLLIQYGDLVFNSSPLSKFSVEDIANVNGHHDIAKLINQTQEERFKILESAALALQNEQENKNYYSGLGLFEEHAYARMHNQAFDERENKTFHCCVIL